MEAELRKLLEPVNNEFIRRLLELEEKQVSLNKGLIEEQERLKKEQAELKAQKQANDLQLSLAKDKLAEERLIQDNLNNQIKAEISRYADLSKEYEQKLKDIEQNLKDSVVEKQLVSDALLRASREAESYQAKTRSLADDFAKLKQQKAEQEEKEKYLLAKEKALNKTETETTQRAHQLNDIDRKLKAREIEVDRLVKRYKLERFIESKGE